MTVLQFLKKYVPKEQRLSAEEDMDHIINGLLEEEKIRTAKEIVQFIKGTTNEIKYIWMG